MMKSLEECKQIVFLESFFHRVSINASGSTASFMSIWVERYESRQEAAQVLLKFFKEDYRIEARALLANQLLLPPAEADHHPLSA